MGNATYYGKALMAILTLAFLTHCGSSKNTLFGETQNDWLAKGDASWQLVNNELVGTINNGSGFVMTKESYKDFLLELEFKPDSTVNSGVFIRCKNQELSFSDCYEINIWDLHPQQNNRTGAVVSRTTPLAHVETLDQWNTYKIKIKGNHLQVWINEVLTADLQNDDLVAGPIALQAAETGEIRFRNVRILPL